MGYFFLLKFPVIRFPGGNYMLSHIFYAKSLKNNIIRTFAIMLIECHKIESS